MFVTVARCEQGVSVVGLGMKNVGSFLKWMSEDIQKESTAELEVSGLEWKDVQKQLQVSARTWYINECNNLLR